MTQRTLLERHRVLDVLVTLVLLVLVGWLSGRLLRAVLIRSMEATVGDAAAVGS